MKYKNLWKEEDSKLVACTDASYGYLPDGGSELGYQIFFVREYNKFSILSW